MWVFASLTHLSWLFCPHHMEVRVPWGGPLASAVSMFLSPDLSPQSSHIRSICFLSSFGLFGLFIYFLPLSLLTNTSLNLV